MNPASKSAYANWHQLLADPRFSPSSKAIQDYLSLCENLESPTPYHVWSFISLLAALAGDKITLGNGPMGKQRLNLGIVLTGIPAIRKSSALTLMQKFADGLPIAYGPTDTAGQRQGIMSAMLPRWQNDSSDSDDKINNLTMETLEELANLNTDNIQSTLPNPLATKASEIYFVSKELGRLIASTSRELLDFLTDGLDGETFHYQLKSQVIKIRHPLMNIIGATTPSSLGTLMPKGGDTHGFLSRLIFVHAPVVDKVVPIPPSWDARQLEVKAALHKQIEAMLDREKQAEISLSKAATETFKDLYAYMPSTMDIRLQAYAGRRAGHLLKVSALLSAMRDAQSDMIIASDLRLAHCLLVLTETNMDRAFFGLDQSLYARVLCAVAELAESSADGKVTVREIQAHAGHLAPTKQLYEMLDSLQTQKKLKQIQSIGNENDTWALQSEVQEMGLARLRTAFLAGPGSGSPAPDEFRPHQVGIQRVIKRESTS